MIVSKPVVPEQPGVALYPPDKLELFPRLTRATYQEQYGTAPAAWDKSRRIKRWFDTSVLENFSGDPENEVVAYDVFDAKSETGTRRMVLTVAEASTPNLPGKMVYPKYVVAPTPALIVTPVTGETQGLNSNTICAYREAVALAAELGLGPDAVRESALGGLFRVEWNGEERRAWVIAWRGENLQVSLLLKLKYANGVGAPGRWNLDATSPTWMSEAQETGEQDTRPEVPIPVRKLLPGEKVASGFGGLMMIQREDLSESPEDEMLKRIDMRVEAIAKYLGV